MPGLIPNADSANPLERVIGRDGSGRVFDFVEQGGNVASTNGGEIPAAPCWQDVFV